MHAPLQGNRLTDALAVSQSNRLLALSFAPGSGIDDNLLLPHELSGVEAISEGFT